MKNNLLPIYLLVGAIVFTSAGYMLAQKKTGSTSAQGVSPDILYITSPVNYFSGEVAKIEGDYVWVNQTVMPDYSGAPPPNQDANSTPIPTPAPKILSFKFKIGPQTSINRPPIFIPYLIKKVEPTAEPKLSAKDIKQGMNISVSVNKDLRKATSEDIAATNIQLPQISNSLSGTVVKVSGNIITMKAVPPVPPGPSSNPPGETEYTVTVTSDTEISRYAPTAPLKVGEVSAPQPPVPELVKLQDIVPNMTISVFAGSDVITNTKITAMRIEPMFPPPAEPTQIPVEQPVIIEQTAPVVTVTLVPTVALETGTGSTSTPAN